MSNGDGYRDDMPSNIGLPQGGWLGMGPAGYYLGQALFRGQREAEEKRQLQDLLRQLRPTTGQESSTTQVPTGRFRVGPGDGETTFPIAPPQADPSLANEIFGPPLNSLMGGGPITPGTRVDAPYDVQPPLTGGPGFEEHAATEGEPKGSYLPPLYTPAQEPQAPPPPTFRREPIPHVPFQGYETQPVTQTRTVQRPGRELLDIIADNPRMLDVLKKYPDLGKLIQAERDRLDWQTLTGGVQTGAQTGAPGASAQAPGAPGATAGPGAAPVTSPAQMTALQRERAQLQQYLQRVLDPRFIGSPAAEKVLKRLGEVNNILESQEKAQTTGDEAARVAQRKSLFEDWARIEEARGNAVGARMYRAGALDDKAADTLIKIREAEGKDALTQGLGKWKMVKDIFGDEVAGELAATEGLEPNMVTPQHLRRAIDNANAAKTIRAKAGATVINLNPSESEDIANQVVTVYNYRRIAEAVRRDPTGWGGPGGWESKIDNVAAKFGWSDAERQQMKLSLNQSGSMLRKAMSGTALSLQEARFIKWIPTGNEESLQELLAKLDSTADNIQRTVAVRMYLRQTPGADPWNLPPHLMQVSTPYGVQDLRQPEPVIPEGGRTRDSQGARERLQGIGVLPAR